ncbi:hypothetical protein EVAR_73664_1, partial [Eumeta japonica]
MHSWMTDPRNQTPMGFIATRMDRGRKENATELFSSAALMYSFVGEIQAITECIRELNTMDGQMDAINSYSAN